MGKKRKLLVGLSVAILFGIIVFGLNPKDFGFSNEVRWIREQSGIRFGKYGLAYTHPSNEWIEQNSLESGGFSIEIALKPKSYHEEGFNIIFVIHDGKDRNQLLVGQWRSHIIVMNGDDYNHKRGIKRIAVNAASLSSTKMLIAITTGKDGAKVYVDGQLAHTKTDLTLKMPDQSKSRLLIGNSVYGKHSWRGDVYGLAFYGYTFTPLDAEIHFNRWSRDQNFLFAKKDNPFILYIFDEKEGSGAIDHGAGNHHLKIPRRMQILKREILAAPWHGAVLNRSFVQDFILNIVGFIPVGFVLKLLFVNIGGAVRKHSALIAVLLCLIISLMIEMVQAWMPSRCSQMLDLMLNTFGALLGVMLYRFSLRWTREGRVDC